MSLDRIDFEKSYSPENCRWADAKTQNGNTRRNVKVQLFGETLLATDAANVLGVSVATVTRRHRASAPLSERKVLKLNKSQVIEIKRRLSMGEGCKEISVDYQVSRQHIAQIRDGHQWRNI